MEDRDEVKILPYMTTLRQNNGLSQLEDVAVHVKDTQRTKL